MSRRRQLSEDEEALWSGFTRTITPLRQKRKSGKAAIKRPPQPPPPPASAGKPAAQPVQPPPVSPSAALPDATPTLAPLGRRFKQRLGRGRDSIDARIDLHGMTQSEAHAELSQFLRRAQAQGARTVLVVTGKGSGRGARTELHDVIERGVLKRQVPLWLGLPEFRRLVVGFDDAHAGHGGQGALYVRLRRER